MRHSSRMKSLIEKMAAARGVDLSQPAQRFRVKSSGFMDLVVETIGRNCVSVAHYYTQNGDLIQDPEIVFWNWGYDGTVGEYGDMGLSPEVHLKLAAQIKHVAEETCSGRLIIVLCGGSRRDLARSLIPQVIKTLLA